MDAARLVAESERVMRGAPQPEDVIEEAWQAGELVEALHRLLAARARGSGTDADPARWTAGTGGRAGPVRSSRRRGLDRRGRPG
jgi:hypothetical protein